MQYITSFNEKLFEATGRTLLNSFERHCRNDNLLVYSEGNIDYKAENITFRPIDDSPVLKNWLNKFKHIIPVEFGGQYQCHCPNANAQKGHVGNCAAGGFRRRASHWFRKVVCWYLAAECLYEPNFVWLDSDCVFNKEIPEYMILNKMQKCPIRFHYGKYRANVNSGIETGLVLFNNKFYRDIDELYTMFINGQFLNQPRWDDAWMLTVLCDNKNILQDGDLNPQCNNSRPMDDGPFADYITHNKGVHWKKFNING